MAELGTVTIKVEGLEEVREALRQRNKRIAELEVAIGKYQLTRSATAMFAMFDLVEKYR